jgi:hypothetical protein
MQVVFYQVFLPCMQRAKCYLIDYIEEKNWHGAYYIAEVRVVRNFNLR